MPAKYAQIGDKYYTVGEGSQLQQISESDIRGRMGDVSDATYSRFGVKPGDWRSLIETPFSGGGIQKLDPSQVTFGKGGEVLSGGQQLNLGGSAAKVQPGTTTDQFGNLPFNQDFAGYLKESGQTFAPETGFSKMPGIQDTAKTSSPFKTGFDQAKAAGEPEVVSDTTQGRDLTNKYSPPTSTSSDIASTFLLTDDFFNNLVKTFQDFIDPKNQRKSLTDTYNQMLKDSGIQALDTELLDMKNVIEGSEEDIRNEVTKAGGFATESQVLALTNSRNKQLIKNYNTLLETRNSKEKYLNTLIGLEAQDREAADKRFETSFNMATQIADYGQKMQANAVASLDRTVKAIGWGGILSATQGDPYTQRLIEKTYGLPEGGLAQAALKETQEKAQAEEKRKLEFETSKVELDLKREQIKTEQAQRAKIVADTQKIVDASKGTVFDLKTPEGQKQAALAKSKIDEIQGVLNSGNLKTTVGPNAFSRYGKIRNVLRPGSADFIASVEQLRSQLNLQSLIDAKAQGATFGALSNQELQVLSNSATKLGVWAVGDRDSEGNIVNVTGYKVKESDFKRELDKINNFAKLDYIYRGGSPEDISVQVIDGKYYTKNSDGSVTEL